MNRNIPVEQNSHLSDLFKAPKQPDLPYPLNKKGLLQTMRKQPCTENPVVAILLINISMIGIS